MRELHGEPAHLEQQWGEDGPERIVWYDPFGEVEVQIRLEHVHDTVRRRWFDRFEQPILHGNTNIHGAAYTPTGEPGVWTASWFDSSLQPATAEGTHGIRFERDELGRTVRRCGADLTGTVTTSAVSGFTCEHRRYEDARFPWKPTHREHRDANGALTQDTRGRALVTLVYDAAGRLTEESSFGTDGAPVHDAESGCHTLQWRWHPNRAEKRCLDAEGELTDSRVVGYAYRIFTLDASGFPAGG